MQRCIQCGVLLLSLFFLSCSKKSDSEKISKIDKGITSLNDSVYVSPNKHFLDLFKDEDLTVKLIAPPEDVTRQLAGSTHLKNDFLPLFPKFFPVGNPENPAVYALSKFVVDKSTLGLLTQNEQEKKLSSINLLLYNRQAEMSSQFIELADKASDDRFTSDKRTVLVKDSSGVKGLMKYETSVKPLDANDPTIPVTNTSWYRIEIKSGRIDTAKASSADIASYRRYFN